MRCSILKIPKEQPSKLLTNNETSGTIICISIFIVANVAIMLLENERIQKGKNNR